MRIHRTVLAFSISVGCVGRPSGGPPADSSTPVTPPPGRDAAGSPELAQRADSLSKLDAEAEARAAIARGDLRFIAVCGFACLPPGVPMDSARSSRDSLALRGDSLLTIAGTSDAVVNQDVARLNDVAAAYARRYNRLIWERRVALRLERPGG